MPLSLSRKAKKEEKVHGLAVEFVATAKVSSQCRVGPLSSLIDVLDPDEELFGHVSPWDPGSVIPGGAVWVRVAQDALRTEGLQHRLSQIADEIQDRKPRPKPGVLLQTLQRIARQIRDSKREELQQIRDLEKWTLSLAALAAGLALPGPRPGSSFEHVPRCLHPNESVLERSERVRGFWEQFHRGSRKGEKRPPSSKFEGSQGLKESGWKLRSSRGWHPRALDQKHDKWAASLQSDASLSPKSSMSCTAASFTGFGLTFHSESDKDPPDAKPKKFSKAWWWQAGAGELEGGGLPQKKFPFIGLAKSSSMPDLRQESRPRAPRLLLPAIGQQTAKPVQSRGDSSSTQLPPILDAFSPPHGHEREPGSPDKPYRESCKRYLEACDRDKVLPLPASVVTGPSASFDFANKALVDLDLMAMASTISAMPIKEVDLGGNTLLSDHALAAFLKALHDSPSCSTLEKLSLSHCHHAGVSAQKAALRLLADGPAERLRELNLSGVSISVPLQSSLCGALQNHSYMSKVSLADTGIGSTLVSGKCLAELLEKNSIIETLDLGWNTMPAKVLALLGDAVVAAPSLKSISLAHCACSEDGDRSPVLFFVEKLARENVLTEMDISANRLDHLGALAVEESLEFCKSLRSLDMSSNPIGISGLRSLLRLLCREKVGLKVLKCEKCHSLETSSFHGMQGFNYTNPSGEYRLFLERPSHRAVLRMLLKMCDRLQISQETAFIPLTSAQWKPPPKSGNSYSLPEQGLLPIKFSLEKGFERFLKVPDWDLENVVAQFQQAARFKPSLKRCVHLLAHWRILEGEVEQVNMLLALGKDFLLPSSFVRVLAAYSVDLTGTLLGHLLPCVEGPVERYHVLRTVQSVPEYVKMLQLSQEILHFNPSSPTGHYALNLRNSADFRISQALAVLDRWEVGVLAREARPDVSQTGHPAVVRNVKYCGNTLDCLPYPDDTNTGKRFLLFSDFHLPEEDFLELDYSSAERPPPEARTLAGKGFTEFMVAVQGAQCSSDTKVLALRRVAHQIYLTSKQLRELLALFRLESEKADVFVTFFPRVADMRNEKVLRVSLVPETLLQLRHRLGWATFFPFLQPGKAPHEPYEYKLNLSVSDERLAAVLLLYLAKAEKKDNLQGSTFWSHLPPDSWATSYPEQNIKPPLVTGAINPDLPENLEGMEKVLPKFGTLTLVYNVHEDQVSPVRKQLFAKYGWWQETVDELDLTSWTTPTTLAQVPTDVLHFVFLLQTLGGVEEAFAIFDVDVQKKGILKIEKFEEVYLQQRPEQGWERLHSDNESQRLRDVFHFLDVEKSKEVSKKEWAILQSIWLEAKLCIHEFVSFCLRTHSDLQAAWDVLDPEAAGHLQLEDWDKAVAKLGFFGNKLPVFHYLDQDGARTIHPNNFKSLHPAFSAQA